jgi:hypothetical protein
MTFRYPDRKTKFIHFISLTVFVLATAMLAPRSADGQFLHPKVSAKQTTIRKVVIMPAKVDVVRDSMKGPEGMGAESEELSARITRLVSEALAAKNVAALTTRGSESGEVAAEQKYSIADIQSRYDDLLPKIARKRKDVKKGRFTMGDEVLNLNLDKSADAIVFIRGQGQKLTSGKKAFVLLVGGAPAYLRLTIGIIDARSGEVLLYTDPVYVGDPTTAKDQSLRKSIDKSLKKLPGAS